jgi:hypothetical protein
MSPKSCTPPATETNQSISLPKLGSGSYHRLSNSRVRQIEWQDVERVVQLLEPCNLKSPFVQGFQCKLFLEESVSVRRSHGTTISESKLCALLLEGNSDMGITVDRKIVLTIRFLVARRLDKAPIELGWRGHDASCAGLGSKGYVLDLRPTNFVA